MDEATGAGFVAIFFLVALDFALDDPTVCFDEEEAVAEPETICSAGRGFTEVEEDENDSEPEAEALRPGSSGNSSLTG